MDVPPLVKLAAFALVLALGPLQVSYGQTSLGEFQQAVVDVIEAVEPSVVAIVRSPEGVGANANADPFASPFSFRDWNQGELGFSARRSLRFQPTGAGVVIDSAGLVLTQYLNVRAGDRHTVVTTDGQTLPALIRGADPRSGLAVLEVEQAKLTAIAIGDGDKLRKGQFVTTVGNPQSIVADGQASASTGIVANLAQRATATTNLNNTTDESGQNYATTLHHLGTLLQTDAKLNWLTGGGAVVNLSGELIGVTTTAGTLPGHESPAGYAIPMTSTFRRVVADLKAGREVEYGLLGLQLAPPSRRVTDSGHKSGAVVSQIFPGSAAYQAGLKVSDQIVGVDGREVADVVDIQRLVGGLPPGTTIDLKLLRGETQLNLPVTLSKYFVRGQQVITAGNREWRGMSVDYPTAIPSKQLLAADRAGLIDADGCVVVRTVTPESSSAKAGVQPGMFISHVGDQRVSTPNEFYAAVEQATETVDIRFTNSASNQGIDEGI